MVELGLDQVSWSLLPRPVVPQGTAVSDEPRGRSPVVAVRKQSRDLWAGPACTAPVLGCESAAGRSGSQRGPGAEG